MVSCETSESTSNPFIGIVLVLLACCCYAFGNCLQRYSLLKAPGEKVLCLNRHMGWLLGAVIYFSANGLYAVALSFAPVSVLAAVFSLTIIVNALCAVFILGDKIPKLAYPGYVLVLTGSVIFSVVVNAQVCHFDGDELIEIMTSASAILFWVVLAGIMLGGAVFAWRFEKAHPLVVEGAETPTAHMIDDSQQQQPEDYVKMDGAAADGAASNVAEPSTTGTGDKPAGAEDHIDPKSLLLARFIYPATLGAVEATGALVLKAINSLLTTIATEDDEAANADDTDNDNIGLWVGLIGVGICLFLGIVVWLRLVYSRFEITGAFPVEFGMLTFGSVVGGFAVFQDYNFVNTTGQWVGVGCAGASILGGIGIVGWASWKAKMIEEEEQNKGESELVAAGYDAEQ
jgi:hypothetical protein